MSISIFKKPLKLVQLLPINEDENRQTMPPPAPMVGRTHQPQQMTPQQQLMQKRQMMQQYEPIKRQLLDLTTELSDAARQVERSVGSLKTKQAVSDAQQSMQLLSQIQQLLSKLPVMEGKEPLTEDHGNLLEKMAEVGIEKGGQYAFQASLAIHGGDYKSAIEMLHKAIRIFMSSVKTLEKHQRKIPDAEI